MGRKKKIVEVVPDYNEVESETPIVAQTQEVPVAEIIAEKNEPIETNMVVSLSPKKIEKLVNSAATGELVVFENKINEIIDLLNKLNTHATLAMYSCVGVSLNSVISRCEILLMDTISWIIGKCFETHEFAHSFSITEMSFC